MKLMEIVASIICNTLRILKYLKGLVSEKELLPGTVVSFPFGL